MSTENDATPTETLDPMSDAFGADEAEAPTGTGAEDAANAEEWGEDKPEGEDEDGEDDPEDDEADEGDKPESHRVPISRLKKEVEKRRALAAEVAELRAKFETLSATSAQPAAQEPARAGDPLADLRKADPDIAKIEAWIAQHDPEKVNPDDYATQGDYQRAVTAAMAQQSQGILELRARQNAHQMAQSAKATQAQAAELAYFEKLGSRYDAAISASKIPNAATYAKNIANRANQLAPEIQRAILEHPEPDVIAAALGSSRKTFDEFAAASKKGVTSSTMMRLGEVVAAYKAGMSRGGGEVAPDPRKPLESPRRRPSGGDPTRSEDRGGILSIGSRSLSETRKELGLY